MDIQKEIEILEYNPLCFLKGLNSQTFIKKW